MQKHIEAKMFPIIRDYVRERSLCTVFSFLSFLFDCMWSILGTIEMIIAPAYPISDGIFVLAAVFANLVCVPFTVLCGGVALFEISRNPTYIGRHEVIIAIVGSVFLSFIFWSVFSTFYEPTLLYRA